MRKEIWNSMLDADMNARYWGELSRKYYSREKWAKIFLAVMASSTVASWQLWGNYELIWKALSALSALLAIALPILNWPKMIQNMVYLTEKWNFILADYELLWFDVKNGIDDEKIKKVTKELKILKNKESTLSQKEANLPNNRKLLSCCHKNVIKSRGV